MSTSRVEHTRSAIWFDIVGNGANPIAPFQVVAYATQSEIDTAVSAGYIPAGRRPQLIAGQVVIPAVVGSLLSGTIATRRIAGVTMNAAKNGDEVLIQTAGRAQVMCNAAVAFDAVVHPVARATRTTAQTPLTNLSEMLVPFDPSVTLTYQLCMIDDPSLTFNSSGANAPWFPLGVALDAATAQYDVIPVELANLYQPVVG